MREIKKHIIRWVAPLMLFSFSGLAAENTVSLSAGLWLGDRTSEMETRLMLDDLIEGNIMRLNFPWKGGYSATLFPLSLQFKTDFMGGKAVLNGSLMRNISEYNFDGISFGGGGNMALSMVTIESYSENNIDVDAGYEMTFGGKFFVTPFLGFRNHNQYYEVSEFTIGSPSGMSLESNFSGNSQSLYGGVGGKYQIVKSWSVFADYRQTMPLLGNLRGSMSSMNKRFYTDGTIKWDEATASYDIAFKRFTVGGQYDLTEKVHLFAGLMKEEMEVFYPEYKSMPLIINTGTGAFAMANSAADSIYEYFTDQFFVYQMPLKTEKGIVFGGATFDLAF